MGLVVCSACGRHVRGDDDACPFCGTMKARGKTVTRRRMSRSAMLGAAVVAVSCHSTSSSPADAGAAAVTVYGGPPSYSGMDGGSK